MEEAHLDGVRHVVTMLQAALNVLHRPELRFLLEFLQQLNAELPPPPPELLSSSEASSGSEVEPDIEGTVAPDR